MCDDSELFALRSELAELRSTVHELQFRRQQDAMDVLRTLTEAFKAQRMLAKWRERARDLAAHDDRNKAAIAKLLSCIHERVLVNANLSNEMNGYADALVVAQARIVDLKAELDTERRRSGLLQSKLSETAHDIDDMRDWFTP